MRFGYWRRVPFAISGIDQPSPDLTSLADQLKMVAEPKRLRILHMLMEGAQCYCDLGDALGIVPDLIPCLVGIAHG